PTYPLDMVAALSPDKKSLLLAVVNATNSGQEFDLKVEGIQLGHDGKLWQMTGPAPDATDHVGRPPQVGIKETSVDGMAKTLAVAPISVNVYQFPLTQ